MRILFDHLHKTGGMTVSHHLQQKYRGQEFAIDPHEKKTNDSLREFASLPETVRHDFLCVHGHFARSLRALAHPKMQMVTVLRHPVDRVVSLYRFHKMHPHLFYHPLCRVKSLARCVREIPEFSNYYAKTIDVTQYHAVALGPTALLDLIGCSRPYVTINESIPFEITQEDLEAVRELNQRDIAIYESVHKQAQEGPGPVGVWLNPKPVRPMSAAAAG